ncbi:hypothetical protein B296_00014103 [Ensete ventricosum]|uniref:Uncharacterized protein n=1 Tax=Ensete ventricosum TaxID=4639 RepID=A0A426Z0R1_ENSVE|nr:hypothetical protein B296_00014103 [Ensete ventricosum]
MVCRFRAVRTGFSSPSSSFSLPRLISLEIGRRRSKSIVTVQQRSETVEIDRYRSISGGNKVETALVGGIARPSTFAQSAKLRRLAAAKEKELQKSM